MAIDVFLFPVVTLHNPPKVGARAIMCIDEANLGDTVD
jgi:hypothetical protein